MLQPLIKNKYNDNVENQFTDENLQKEFNDNKHDNKIKQQNQDIRLNNFEYSKRLALIKERFSENGQKNKKIINMECNDSMVFVGINQQKSDISKREKLQIRNRIQNKQLIFNINGNNQSKLAIEKDNNKQLSQFISIQNDKNNFNFLNMMNVQNQLQNIEVLESRMKNVMEDNQLFIQSQIEFEQMYKQKQKEYKDQEQLTQEQMMVTSQQFLNSPLQNKSLNQEQYIQLQKSNKSQKSQRSQKKYMTLSQFDLIESDAIINQYQSSQQLFNMKSDQISQEDIQNRLKQLKDTVLIQKKSIKQVPKKCINASPSIKMKQSNQNMILHQKLNENCSSNIQKIADILDSKYEQNLEDQQKNEENQKLIDQMIKGLDVQYLNNDYPPKVIEKIVQNKQAVPKIKFIKSRSSSKKSAKDLKPKTNPIDQYNKNIDLAVILLWSIIKKKIIPHFIALKCHKKVYPQNFL